MQSWIGKDLPDWERIGTSLWVRSQGWVCNEPTEHFHHSPCRAFVFVDTHHHIKIMSALIDGKKTKRLFLSCKTC